MNAQDLRGVTPLHLALSRLKILGDSEEKKACPSPSSSSSLPRDAPLVRKREMMQVSIVTFFGGVGGVGTWKHFALPWGILNPEFYTSYSRITCNSLLLIYARVHT